MDITRLREQEALQKIRTLSDELEQAERAQARWQRPAVVGVLVSAALGLAWLASMQHNPSPSDAEQRRHACQLDAWAARSGDMERELRQAHPEKSYREIAKILERERPFVMAAAKVDCDARNR